MMAFVEHIAGRYAGIVDPAKRGLRHDQRVVRDNKPRVPRRPHILLDKAAAEMRAGSVDALAAPVGQRIDPAAPDQLGEPAWKIAGDEIARRGRADPARD